MAERGTYTSIPRALLAGKDFRALPERARWIFFVLKLNVSAAGIDIWYPDELAARISSESGASLDQVRLTLDILEHENWIRREENVLWVVGHITHDPHLRPSDPKHRKNTQRHLAGLPRMALARAFIKGHPEWFPKSECSLMGLAWAFEGSPKTLRSKRRKEKDTDTEKDIAAVADSPKTGLAVLSKPDCDALFGHWGKLFGAWDYGLFRKELLKAYQSGLPIYTLDEMLAAMTAAYEWWIEQDDRDQAFFKLDTFVKQLGSKWIRFGKMGLQEHGEMTERGTWAGSKAIRESSRRPRIA